MKLMTIGPLTQRRVAGIWGIDGKDLICSEGLRQYFNVPKSAKKVWVELHDTPDKSRIRVKKIPDSLYRLGFGERARQGIIVYFEAARMVDKLNADKIYAEVHYKT